MIVITQCCVEALYKLGPEYQSSTNTAKTFERRRCNHREAIDPDECLKDVIGGSNKHNYVLAAQSASLRQKLQNVPGLPIIHFNPREVLVLSPPSIATTRQKNTLEEERRKEAEKGLGEVVDGANVIGGGGPSGSGSGSQLKEEKARARKKINAPNPLSVRKKKVEKGPREETVEQPSVTEDLEGEVDAGGKRRKKRKRGRGKGAVAEARAELAGMGEGNGGEGSGSGSGSDGESD
jgi:U3 small nucleolar RNA-associated protein 23